MTNIGAPPVERGFSPLAERLHLAPSAFSPELVALAVQMATELPFAKAATLLQAACGTTISHDTVRRLTEAAGAHAAALEQDLIAAITTAAHTPFADAVIPADADPIPAEVAVQLSLDGAMVSLRGGEWAEVRTLVVGELAPQAATKATALSYASALATAEDFSATITGELTRRGVDRHPGPMVAVTDGATWIQALLDAHVPRSVRVLDLMHAVEYLAAAARVAFGQGTAETSDWIATQRAALRRGPVRTVLDALMALPMSPERDTALGYLRARLPMLDYPRCDAHGWPVGSGIVESANKLVVEARLKRSGMHWARGNVTPMLMLRTLSANGRWATTWPRIVQAWRQDAARPAARCAPPPHVPTPPIPPDPAPAPPAIRRPPQTPMMVNGKPTSAHPWNARRPKLRAYDHDPQ